MDFLGTIVAVGTLIIGELIEGAVVVLLFNVASTLETFSANRARNAVKSLPGLSPEHAHLYLGGRLVKRDVKDIHTGQVLSIKPGKRIPLDGRVVKGTSYVNQSPITGNVVLKAEVLKDYKPFHCFQNQAAGMAMDGGYCRYGHFHTGNI